MVSLGQIGKLLRTIADVMRDNIEKLHGETSSGVKEDSVSTGVDRTELAENVTTLRNMVEDLRTQQQKLLRSYLKLTIGKQREDYVDMKKTANGVFGGLLRRTDHVVQAYSKIKSKLPIK